MANHIAVGKIGEDFAYKWLIENGYVVLFRNHREGFDEIDLIAKSKDGALVFFEVKTLRADLDFSSFTPEDNLNRKKLFKISRACMKFAAKHPELVNDKNGWRIDLLAINLNHFNEVLEIRHYENIF